MCLLKIVASFSSTVVIVCINYDDQNRFEFNVCVPHRHKSWYVRVTEILMPRFYFHLSSKDDHVPDDSGKELATLNDAYGHARKLIHKILLHVGHDDAEAWKVVIFNDEHDAQMIVPFSVAQHRATVRESCKP